MADNDPQITYYGYEGDSTPDTNSALGIGDRDNQLVATPELTSVALTKSERMARFGVSGSSTGQVFEHGGRTYRDDDTAPEGNRRIDVYAPSHPPDTGGSHLGLSASVREYPPYDLSQAISPASSQDYVDPTSAEDKPHDILSPDSVTSRIKSQYPQYEKADSQTVYEKFVKKYQAPLEQLRALYPEYKDKSDTVFTEGIRKKYYPNESADDFKDRMTPPTGVSGATKNFLKPLIPDLVKSWYASTGDVAQKMQNIGQKNEEMQKAFTDSDAWINDRLGQITKALHADAVGSALQESYGEIDKGFRETAAALFNWGKQQKAQGEAIQAPKPQGIAGHLGAAVGTAIGSTPEAAVTFLPNLTPTGAVLWAMASAGVSTEADAKEAKDPNSTPEGLVAGGAAGVMRWMMNNPRGWLISGLWNAAIGMGEEQAQRFLSGNKDNDLDKTAATGAIDFVLGAMMGHGRERLPKAASESIDKAFQARESGDIQKALELTDQAMLFLPDKQKAEVGQLMLKWRDDVIPMKDSPTPELPTPRAERVTPTEPSGPVILQPDSLKTKRRTKPEVSPVATNPAALIHDAYKGLLKNQQGSAVFISDLAKKTGMSVTDLHSWIDKENRKGNLVLDVGHWPSATDEQRTSAVKQYGEPRLLIRFPKISDAAKDQVSTQFYFGFGGAPKMLADFLVDTMPKVRAGLETAAEKTGVSKFAESWRRYWEPESISERATKAGAIIARENTEMAADRQRLMNITFTRQKVQDDLQFSHHADRRDAFWNSKDDGTLKSWAELREQKKSTGNPQADFLLKTYGTIADATARMDERNDIHYDLVDTYIPRAIKNKADMARVESYIRTRWGDPSFMKHRAIPDLVTLHRLGIELQTYNFERMFQVRLYDSLKAQARVRALNRFTEEGLAIPTKELKSMPVKFQKEITESGEFTRVSSPNGAMFMVHKDADFMLHRAWDRATLYDNLWGQPFKWANTLKRNTVGLRLGGPTFHAFHMLDISLGNELAATTEKFLASKGTGKDLLDALANVSTGGIKVTLQATLGKYSHILDFYNGDKGVGWKDLSPEEQQQVLYHRESGIAPVVSQERREQVARWLEETAPIAKRTVIPAYDIFYKVATMSPFQERLFKRWIPSMKMYAADKEIANLFDRRPELMKPENSMERQVELRKIGRAVDTRFGEVFYDNVFWPKNAKLIGQAMFTSLGWRIGAWRTHAAMVHDLTNNVYHADELIKQFRLEGGRPVAQRLLTNNTMYWFHYMASTFMKNAIITAAFGGGLITIRDLFYPRIGKKKNGEDERLKMPFFSTDPYSLWHAMHEKNWVQAVFDDFKYKLQPDLVMLDDLFRTNKDYRGTQIVDPHENFANQMGQFTGYVLTQSLPMSWEPTLHPKPGADWRDKLFPVLGLPSAPAWTGRSDLDNDILAEWYKTLPQEKTQEAQKKSEARARYKDALLSNDGHAALSIRKELHDLGMSDAAIDKMDKEKSISAGKLHFKNISPKLQTHFLQQMSPQERKEYLPYASKKIQEQLSHEHNQ